MTRGDTRTTETVAVTGTDPVAPEETVENPGPVEPEETEAETEERENERLRKENDRLATEVHNLRALVDGVGNPGEELQKETDDDFDPRVGVEAIFRGATGHNPDEEPADVV